MPVMADIPGKLRDVEGNPASGPILRGPSGKPFSLDNLIKRLMSPLLKAAGLEWHGWYSLRRGVAKPRWPGSRVMMGWHPRVVPAREPCNHDPPLCERCA